MLLLYCGDQGCQAVVHSGTDIDKNTQYLVKGTLTILFGSQVLRCAGSSSDKKKKKKKKKMKQFDHQLKNIVSVP